MPRLLICLLLGVLAVNLSAATDTWSGSGGDAAWGTAANWTGHAIPASGDVLIFPANALGSNTLTNNLPAGTVFSTISVTGIYTFSGNAIGLEQSLTITPVGGALTLDLPITLQGDVTISGPSSPSGGPRIEIRAPLDTAGHDLTLMSGGDIFLLAPLTGSGLVVLNGPVFCRSVSTLTGDVVVSGGDLTIDDGFSVGTGTIRVEGAGMVQLGEAGSGQGSSPIANPWEFSTTAVPALVSWGPADLCTGAMALDSTTTFSASDVSLELAGVLSGAGGLRSAGTGDLILSATNTFQGAVELVAGNCVLRDSGGLGAGTQPYQVDQGAALVLDRAASGGSVSGVELGGTLLTLSGSGPTGQGCLIGDFASSAVLLPIALNGDCTIGSYSSIDGPAVMMLSGIHGTGALTYVGDGSIQVTVPGTYSGTTTAAVSTFFSPGTCPGPLVVGVGTTVTCDIDQIFQSSAPVTVEAGAQLDVRGTTQAIGSLAGAGTLLVADSMLTFGGDDSSQAFSGMITSTAGAASQLIKTGTGSWTLSGTSTFSGGFTVQGGTVEIDGTSTVNSVQLTAGTLTGIGSIGAITATGGTISPAGPALGIMTSAGITLSPAATLALDVTGTIPGYSQDELISTGAIILGGAALVFSAPPPATGAVLIHNLSGQPIQGTLVSAYPLTTTGGGGTDLALTNAATTTAGATATGGATATATTTAGASGTATSGTATSGTATGATAGGTAPASSGSSSHKCGIGSGGLALVLAGLLLGASVTRRASSASGGSDRRTSPARL